MSQDKILQFPSAEPLSENLIQIDISNRPLFCSHDSISLDEHNRAVNCIKCGAVLDPFNFLMTNARTLQQAWWNYRDTTRKVGELTDRVCVLIKEEKRLKGMVKRLQEKLPIISVKGNKNGID